jgi:hypothetical protein
MWLLDMHFSSDRVTRLKRSAGDKWETCGMFVSDETVIKKPEGNKELVRPRCKWKDDN